MIPPVRYRATEAEDAEILRLRSMRWSRGRIAVALHRGETFVQYRLKVLGQRGLLGDDLVRGLTKRRLVTPAEDAEILRLRKLGWTRERIGAQIGRGKSFVQYRLGVLTKRLEVLESLPMVDDIRSSRDLANFCRRYRVRVEEMTQRLVVVAPGRGPCSPEAVRRLPPDMLQSLFGVAPAAQMDLLHRVAAIEIAAAAFRRLCDAS